MRLLRLGHPKRIFGLGLMLASLVGLVGAVAGLIVVPRAADRVAVEFEAALGSTVATLDTAGETLALVDETLGETAAAIGAAGSALGDVEQTLGDSADTLDSLDGLLGDDLPEIIRSTRQSLRTTQDSAEVIESMLTGLNAISGLTGVSYDPEVSLADSVGEIDSELAGLPSSLQDVADDLGTVSGDLESTQEEIDALGERVYAIEATVEASQIVIAEYRATLDDLAADLGVLEERIPAWLRRGRTLVTFLLIWFGLAQIGLFWQGWEMLRFDHAYLARRVRDLEETVERLEAHHTAGDEIGGEADKTDKTDAAVEPPAETGESEESETGPPPEDEPAT
jgi:hypothetical protein